MGIDRRRHLMPETGLLSRLVEAAVAIAACGKQDLA